MSRQIWRSALSSSITRTSGRSATPIVAADAIIGLHGAPRQARTLRPADRARARVVGVRLPEGPGRRALGAPVHTLRDGEGRVPAARGLSELPGNLRRARRVLRQLDAAQGLQLPGRPGA